MEHTKNILIIGDMPGYGKMGLAGMLPILSNMGHSVYNLPTALVSNNFDYGKFSVLDTTAYMEETIRVWQTLGFQFDCITTGFLASAAQVDLLRAFIDSQRKTDFLVVTDPIMGDGGKLYNGSTPQTVDNMRRFVGAADVIVPNLTEAEFLTGLYKGEELLAGERARRILDGWETDFLTAAEAWYLATSAGAAFFGEGPGFAPGNALHALVLDDSRLLQPHPLTPEERLERCLYVRQPGAVRGVWSAGRRVFSPED